MNDYMTLLHKHKINGGFLAPDRIPMEERNKNEMILELQNEVHTKDKEIERLNSIINELEKCIKFDYLEECEYQANIRKSDLMQGDYPVRYYYSEQNTKLQTKYLNKLQELKGSGK